MNPYERQVIAQYEREFESTIFTQPVASAKAVSDAAVFAVLGLFTAGWIALFVWLVTS